MSFLAILAILAVLLVVVGALLGRLSIQQAVIFLAVIAVIAVAVHFLAPRLGA